MPWFPKYTLYAANGTTPVYAFDYILSDNSPIDTLRFTEITGFRGQGSIVIGGSIQPWDLELTFFLCKTNYETLIAAMDSVESTIVMNTPYVLKIDRTISTTKDYNVKRLTPIQWEDTKRVKYQKGTIIFRVNSW
jgi:hypothetical protein